MVAFFALAQSALDKYPGHLPHWQRSKLFQWVIDNDLSPPGNAAPHAGGFRLGSDWQRERSWYQRPGESSAADLQRSASSHLVDADLELARADGKGRRARGSEGRSHETTGAKLGMTGCAQGVGDLLGRV